MRLTQEEQKLIKNAVNKYDNSAKVFLFGSRVHDDQRGGDIDLLCISDEIDRLSRRNIRLDLLERLGEQKIDLIVRSTENAKEDAFVKSIFQNSVEL